VLVDWGKPSEFPHFSIPVRPNHRDPRITLQRSCFTFHIPTRTYVTTAENSTLCTWLIPRAAKLNLRNELALLGIDDFTIYGDMVHLASRLTAAYRS
jgi:hypothetical protein